MHPQVDPSSCHFSGYNKPGAFTQTAPPVFGQTAPGDPDTLPPWTRIGECQSIAKCLSLSYPSEYPNTREEPWLTGET